jgi:hypothetical protein
LILCAISFLSCKKQETSVYKEAHLALEKIARLASTLDTKEKIYESFNKMKTLILGYNKVLIKITSYKYKELDAIAKKHPDDVKSFGEYQKSITENENTGFIRDMKRIGSLSLEGQKLRNAFFEAIYRYNKRLKKLFKQAS